jgi:hypothetical protein
MEGSYEECRRYYYEVAKPKYIDRVQAQDDPRADDPKG